MHLSISHLMQLDFWYHIWAAVIFLLNLPGVARSIRAGRSRAGQTSLSLWAMLPEFFHYLAPAWQWLLILLYIVVVPLRRRACASSAAGQPYRRLLGGHHRVHPAHRCALVWPIRHQPH